MQRSFKALLVSEKDGKYVREIVERPFDSLPQGEVLVQVHYSSLNYKDALSAHGNKGVTKSYPHVPGIDACGIVEESTSDDILVGDKVIVTSYDLGMNTSGGFSEYIRVPAAWVVKLPTNLTLRESMIYGTAGFTAALSVSKLIRDVKRKDGTILVTGGTGGVATLAVKMLKKLGYRVVVATGKLDMQKNALLKIGADEVISREEVDDKSGRPLLKPKWAGVIDTGGGNILATALKTTQPNGVVTACGNIGGAKLETTVFPFILNGVSLKGIDSATCPMEIRQKVWESMATDWKPDDLEDMVNEVDLKGLLSEIEAIMNGQHIGRTIVCLKPQK